MSDTSNDRKQELLMLGEIHGIVKSIQAGQQQLSNRMDQSDARQEERHKQHNERMDRMEERQEERHESLDKRLREVEKKAAVAGALSGGAIAIGTTLVVEGLKQFVMSKGIGN